jgi:hypothetical protein
MKIIKALALIMAAAGLLAFALPAQAQSNRHGGGNSNGGGMHHSGGGHNGGGHNHGGWHSNPRYHYGGGSRANFYFGGAFGYPFFGYPFFGYPYYGYAPYGYGYPGGAYYTYDPRGVYQGRVVNGAGAGSNSVAVQVQQQLAAGGYYRGEIDGIIGDGTRRAIRNYERANNLPVDGQIDDQLLTAMGPG